MIRLLRRVIALFTYRRDEADLAREMSSRVEVLSTTTLAGVAPAIAGLIAGLPVAWLLAQMFPTLFFEVGPRDVASCVIGPAILLLVAIGAALVPARRATRIDPLVALRSE